MACEDLDTAIGEYQANGFLLLALGPADEPCWAELSDGSATVILETKAEAARSQRRLTIPEAKPTLAISHETAEGWGVGRAGMRYRDLVPDRYGGTYIASHIHVPDGGPVPDYVHHHDIAYQLIFCHRGWVRVVYQDQGPPFVMGPGDCVLQPPGIRHQVLESSDDLYVVEITCPADHRTNLEYDFELPTTAIDHTRSFGGQRFVRHIAADAPWVTDEQSPFDVQETAIAAATDGLASARVLRASRDGAAQNITLNWSLDHQHQFRFLFLLSGRAGLKAPDGTVEELREGSSAAVPSTGGYSLDDIDLGSKILEICSSVPAR